jgi:hypothetical protein
MSKKPFDNSRITVKGCWGPWTVYLDDSNIGLYYWQWTGIRAAKRAAKIKDKGYRFKQGIPL